MLRPVPQFNGFSAGVTLESRGALAPTLLR